MLEQLTPGRELAIAYCNVSHLFMSVEDAEQTVAWGTRALELAQSLDDAEARVYALTNIAVEHLVRVPSHVDKLEQALQMARSEGLEEHAGRAFVNLVWWAPRSKSYATASRYLEPGLEYCDEYGLDLWRLYLLAYRARRDMDLGRWDEAVSAATLVVRDPRSTPVPRIVALGVMGLIRARQGDPGCWSPLDEAWALAEPTAELQRIEPAAVARAEAAWLEGRPHAVAEATAAAMDLALQRKASWVIGETRLLAVARGPGANGASGRRRAVRSPDRRRMRAGRGFLQRGRVHLRRGPCYDRGRYRGAPPPRPRRVPAIGCQRCRGRPRAPSTGARGPWAAPRATPDDSGKPRRAHIS